MTTTSLEDTRRGVRAIVVPRVLRLLDLPPLGREWESWADHAWGRGLHERVKGAPSTPRHPGAGAA